MLLVTRRVPFPARGSSSRRAHELITRLANRFDIHLCAVTPVPAEDRARVPAAQEHCALVRLLPALDGGDGTAWRHLGLVASLGGFDAVHVERPELLRYLPVGCPAPVVVMGEHGLRAA